MVEGPNEVGDANLGFKVVSMAFTDGECSVVEFWYEVKDLVLQVRLGVLERCDGAGVESRKRGNFKKEEVSVCLSQVLLFFLCNGRLTSLGLEAM